MATELLPSDGADGRDRQKTLALMEIAEALKLMLVEQNAILRELATIRAEVKAIAVKQ